MTKTVRPSQNWARFRAVSDRHGCDLHGKIPADELDRAEVYRLRHHFISTRPQRPTTELIRLADRIFRDILPWLAKTKLETKREFTIRLVQALGRAAAQQGAVAFRRHRPPVELDVIHAVETVDLVRMVNSPPGSKMMSRLVPQPSLTELFSHGPWVVDDDRETQFVFMRRGADKVEIDFDHKHPTAIEFQRKLTAINSFNGKWRISFCPLDRWEMRNAGRQVLRTGVFARFTDDFDSHGRLYSGKEGVQALRASERQWVFFDDGNGNESQGIELDFAALHCRMCYHLENLPCESDPYSLWPANRWRNSEEAKAARLLAKTLINVALNERDPSRVVSACNHLLCWRTDEGQRKTGKALEHTQRLHEALRTTGLTFASIHRLALDAHKPIARWFGSGAGMRLMNIDGRIALQVLFAMTSQGIPCLSIHDSFVCPRSAAETLQNEMIAAYRQHVRGWSPVIKCAPYPSLQKQAFRADH